MCFYRENKLNYARHLFGVAMLGSAIGATLLFTGCASANVDVLTKPQTGIGQPDFILVNNLAVTPNDVEMDRGAISKAVREGSDKTQTEQELEVGKAAAQAFTDALVENLRKAGIRAAKVSDGYKPTDKTLIIKGKFVQISQGNQTMRVLVGFGFGNGDLKAMVEAYQNNVMIARAMVTTTGSRKPGMLVPVAGGAAAGSAVASVAVSGGASVMSESFMATVQCDAQRAAKDVAKKLVKGYINRGWAKPEALDKIDSFF